MKWSNLRNNKCPQCNKDFATGLSVESNMQPTMFKHKCGFKISEERHKEIVADMNTRSLQGKQDVSQCCGARMVAGGVQCEACGSDGIIEVV